MHRHSMEPTSALIQRETERFRLWDTPRSRWCSWPDKIGLQGKIILSAAGLMSMALAASCVMFVWQTRVRLQNLMAEQATQLASALAWSSEDTLRTASPNTLVETAGNLTKSRSIIYVGFSDMNGKSLAEKSRSSEIGTAGLTGGKIEPKELLRVRHRSTQTMGDYFEVTAPIIGRTSSPISDGQCDRELLGYVTVGLSDRYEATQMQRVNVMVLGVGLLFAMLGLPLAYITVSRIVRPIRQLVGATKKIIAGDLDARVAIGRPDEIGDLARSFNDMVLWVKKNQEEIRATNGKLAEANADLEQKVELRTAQLETANDRLSQEIAEKEDFLRAVSHDLNAPLRNISGMATMLLMKHRKSFEEDVVHRLERIKSNVDVETDLINELLELSRIKTRRQKLELVDIEQLIWELRGLFENDLKTKNIDIRLDATLPPMYVERARIRQVFQNLIDNAIKYMGEKVDREIHIGCVPGHTETEFYVRDTGMGIEPEDIDKVFFVFRRGRTSSVQNIAGKGVGLASVKSIIETYSGRIWVESAIGRGSKFRFTINGRYFSAPGGQMLDQAA